jgi:hypothetical protein
VINAVLLAFIAVSVWENFKKAEDAAELEANMVDNIYIEAPPGSRDLSVSNEVYSRLYERVVPSMTIDLNDVRNVEPDYRGISDSMLADSIYTIYFSDLPRPTFDRLLVSKTGVTGKSAISRGGRLSRLKTPAPNKSRNGCKV